MVSNIRTFSFVHYNVDRLGCVTMYCLERISVCLINTTTKYNLNSTPQSITQQYQSLLVSPIP